MRARSSGMNVIAKFIGVGSGGSRIVDAIDVGGLPGVNRALIDCDRTALAELKARKRILVGRELSVGAGGAGSREEIWHAVKKDMAAILSAACPADVVFVVVCMGTGFGSAAAELICGEVKKTGCLVGLVAVQPFELEGNETVEAAIATTREATSFADCVVIVPNSVAARSVAPGLSLEELVLNVNRMTAEALRGLACLVVNRDAMSMGLGDIRGKLSGSYAAIGYGKATGSKAVLKAFTKAATSSLLAPEDCESASRILISIASNREMAMDELGESCDFISARLGCERVNFGFTSDSGLGRAASVTILAGSERFPCHWLSGEMRHLAIGSSAAPRGLFAQMPPTIYNGEDLDVPTYIRHPELLRLD